MSHSLLVTGASGQLGQRVLGHLLDTLSIPANRVVAASRSPDKLTEWAKRGVTLRPTDFDLPQTLPTAFAGIERALLISTDALDRPGRRLQQHLNAVQALAATGVSHVVYTSVPNPENSPLLIAPDHEETEKALAASNIPSWTVLRNHSYFDNLYAALPAALASGKWYAADEGQKAANISRDDLALAAAVALAGEYNGKRTLTLSGPAALTKAEMAATVSAATGRALEVVQVPLNALVQGMVNAGLPETLARTLTSFDTNIAEHFVDQVSNDFQELTGRQPQPFADWVQQHKTRLAAL